MSGSRVKALRREFLASSGKGWAWGFGFQEYRNADGSKPRVQVRTKPTNTEIRFGTPLFPVRLISGDSLIRGAKRRAIKRAWTTRKQGE